MIPPTPFPIGTQRTEGGVTSHGLTSNLQMLIREEEIKMGFKSLVKGLRTLEKTHQLPQKSDLDENDRVVVDYIFRKII
ncbi:hypothetical protein C5167_027955 [Papaver somniferum]|nr:hypothetical protein C5167_027955 [Papaver somniferum]